MIEIIADQSPIYLDFAEEVMASSLGAGFKYREDAKTIALVRNGEIAAVTVYDCFSPTNCNIHITSNGSKRWMTRDFIRACFYYPFIQCNLRRITGLVPAKQKETLEFDFKLGFRFEGILKEAMVDDDLIVLGMTKRECRFINI